MANLTYMRQRIKAIETIKKITHAMRLISMSTHSRLHKQKFNLEQYKKAFQDLYNKLVPSNPSIAEHELRQKNNLTVLVGSQKGLCGNFNSQICKFFGLSDLNLSQYCNHYITVGQYSLNYLKTNHPNLNNLVKSYHKFGQTNFIEIARDIADIVIKNNYTNITVYSTYSKSFFIQEPRMSEIRYDIENFRQDNNSSNHTKYIIEESVIGLVNTIKKALLIVRLEELLFESLLSEQAARFLSMDTATRNANNLLEEMKKSYNKLRQSYITQELSELVSSY